jgi:hypothetical protein
MSSVSVTLTFASLDDAILQLAKLRGSAPAEVAKVTEAPAPKPDGAKPKKDEKPAASAPTASAPPAAAPATPPTASASGAPSYAEVAAMITEKVKTHRAEVVAALTKFSAKNGKELKPEDYAAFAAALTEATKGEETLA